MKRNEWSFDITAEKLAAAAGAKQEFHTGRLNFWKSAQDKVMAEVKEKGISIEESAAGANYSNKSGYGPEIVVDNTFQRRLAETTTKIREHTTKVSEYDGWVQVLAANAGRTYPLNADDYLFFFGK
jgi:hypothetical protein